MVCDGGNTKHLDVSEVTCSMHPNQHLDCLWLLHIINFAVKHAVGSSEDVAACYDRAPTKWLCRLGV